MKLAIAILLSVVVLSALILVVAPPPGGELPQSMPWQVDVIDGNRSAVFGIVLNETRLEEAASVFGPPEEIALYQDVNGEFGLEAYFGKVSMGPLTARLIVNLAADQQAMQHLATETDRRTKTEAGSLKWVLSERQRPRQAQRVITSLTFIPDYAGMDAAYLAARFGEPAARRPIDDSSEYWLYPQTGVRILLDRDGREVFEYVAPARFKLFSGAAS